MGSAGCKAQLLQFRFARESVLTALSPMPTTAADAARLNLANCLSLGIVRDHFERSRSDAPDLGPVKDLVRCEHVSGVTG